VRADKDDAITESNEANNELSESWSCLLHIIPGPIFTFSPDLIITDIWKVSEITGDKIYYKIKNNGLGAAAASKTSLVFYPAVIPVTPVAIDNVGPLAAGEEVTRKFATYNWTGIGTTVAVKADYDDAIVETDNGNNSRSEPTSGL
jgi:subtilase family serine protease